MVRFFHRDIKHEKLNMMKDDYGKVISTLAAENEKRIVLLVMDGIGDCDFEGRGTALQIANTPNMDKLAQESALGQHYPVAPAITPGSGPGHLSLFGYDPMIYKVGRGVLSALGIEFDLKAGDVAARLNFCTIDDDGKVTDRRAGRISTEENEKLIEKINNEIEKPAGIEVFLQTVSEHRALLVMRGEELTGNLGDTDPQETGVEPLPPDREPYGKSATADMVKNLMSQIEEILEDENKANFILTRGFAQLPEWPMFPERYKLKPAAVAGYPMYRGVSRLVKIPVVAEPTTAEDVCKEAVKAMKNHTFVFAHFKYTDKTGEDGDIDKKVEVIEQMDKALPVLLDGNPDVLIITGDHSTPALLKAHSWHPVPVLMSAPYLRGGYANTFDEVSCRAGELGTIKGCELLPIAMAHAGKLDKFGA